MPGDFSRIAFVPQKGYVGVLMQQGRVQLDYDWNQQVDMFRRQLDTLADDVIGPEGGPEGAAGFAVEPRAAASIDAPGSYAEVRDAAPLHFDEDRPFALEVELSIPAHGGAGTILSHGSSRGGAGYRLSLDDDNLLAFRLGERECHAEAPLAAGHSTVRVAFDGRRIRIFVNGALAGMDSGARGEEAAEPANRGAAAQAVSFFIGGTPDAPDHASFGGAIYRVRAWEGEPGAAGRALRTGSGGGLRLIADLGFDPAGDHAVRDASGHEQHGVVIGGRRGRDPAAAELWIGKGRYYVSGVQGEVFEDVSWSKQPYLPGAEPPVGVGRPGIALAYVDLWDQLVTAYQDPSLLDPALDGVDTTVRTRRVWQVKGLPPLPARSGPLPPDVWAELEEQWFELLSWYDVKTRMMARRDPRVVAPIANLLYRVQIQSPGVPFQKNHARVDDLDTLRVERIVTAPPPKGTPNAAIRVAVHDFGPLGVVPAPGQILAAVRLGRPVSDKSPLCRVTHVEDRILTLEFSGDPPNLRHGDRLTRIATYTWSRNNGLDVFPVTDIVDGWVTLGASVRPSGAPLVQGDVVSLDTNRTRLLLDAPGLYAVASVSADGRRVQLTPEPPNGHGEEGDPWLLQRWDVAWDRASVSPFANVVTASGWIDIENGIQIAFGPGGRLLTGDFWAFPSRNAIGGIEWPQRAGRNGAPEPELRRPDGVWHRKAAVAVLRSDGEALSSIDLRRIYKPLSRRDTPEVPPAFYLPSPSRVSPPGYAFTGLTFRADYVDQRWKGEPPIPSDCGLGQVEMVRWRDVLYAFSETGRVWLFEPQEKAWHPRSSGRARGKGFGVGVHGGRIHVVGGTDAAGLPIAVHDAYNPETDRWCRLDDTPFAIAFAGVLGVEAASGPCLMVIGGIGGTSMDACKPSPVATVWTYGPLGHDCHDKEGWRSAPPLPQPRARLAAASVDRVVYAVGGVDEEGNPAHEVYAWQSDPDRPVWSWRVRHRMPVARFDLSATALGGRLHALGGETAEGTLALHEVYEPINDVWHRAPPMNRPRSQFGLASLHGTLVAAAGIDHGSIDSVESYRPGEILYLHRPEQAPEPPGFPVDDERPAAQKRR